MIEFSVRLMRQRVFFFFFNSSSCSKSGTDSRFCSHWRVTESSTLLDSEDIALESDSTLPTLPMYLGIQTNQSPKSRVETKTLRLLTLSQGWNGFKMTHHLGFF